LIRDSLGPPRQKSDFPLDGPCHPHLQLVSQRLSSVPSVSLMQATQAGSRTFNSSKSTFCPSQNTTHPSSSSPARTQKRSQNVGKLCCAQPAALPPRLHGLLDRHDLGCMWLDFLTSDPLKESHHQADHANSASETRGVPTAKSFSIFRARPTRSTAAPRRSLRGSSPSHTPASRGLQSGSASTSTYGGFTQQRSLASCPMTCVRR